MTKHILARGNAGRNSDNPRVVVGNHVIRSPMTWSSITVDKTGFVNLVEEQLGLVNRGAVVATGGKVVHHWSLV
jgi:hypothetical protein